MLNPLANIPQDKAGHFLVGLLIYALLHFISPVVGLLAVAVAAICKEVYDYMNRPRNNPEIMDALATVCGGIVGFICGV